MNSRNKKPIGISILITIVSITLCSIYIVKNLNITINANTKDNKVVVEVTSTPATSIPTETSSTATTAPEQTETPAPPTASPTEQPPLTVETIDNTEKITEKDLEKYCLDSSDAEESDNQNDDEKDNQPQTTNENNPQKTIDIKENSQIIMATNPEQVDDDSNILTINRSKRTVSTITPDNNTENETTAINTSESTASPGSDKNTGDDDNTSQTFSLNDICNYNFSETNNNYNIKYINLEPGEYTITLNNPSIEINYYVVPDIALLFTNSEATTAPNSSDEEPSYEETQEIE